MERQSILERCGWEFIRIRGSKYFRNPESTMKDVINELNKKGIFPEKMENENYLLREEELLNKIKTRAFEILQTWDDNSSEFDDTLVKVSKNKSTNTPVLVNIPIPEKIENEIEDEKIIKEDVKKIDFNDNTSDVDGRDIFKFLDDEGVNYIDHRMFSGLLWVIYDEEKKEKIENFFKAHNYNYSLEKRGVILTSGKAAWRLKNL